MRAASKESIRITAARFLISNDVTAYSAMTGRTEGGRFDSCTASESKKPSATISGSQAGQSMRLVSQFWARSQHASTIGRMFPHRGDAKCAERGAKIWLRPVRPSARFASLREPNSNLRQAEHQQTSPQRQVNLRITPKEICRFLHELRSTASVASTWCTSFFSFAARYKSKHGPLLQT